MVEDLIIAVIAAVVVGGGTAGLVPFVRSRRRSVPPADQPRAGGAGQLSQGGAESAGTATGTLAPPEPGGPVAPPDVTAPPEQPPSRVVEKPPPSAGRLTRLRGRLARSHSAIGSVLLNLISSGRLDEQAWEEIEDMLITADMGVGPARELVEELKTEVKVAGTTDSAAIREMLRTDLIAMINPDMDRTLHLARHGDRPSVVLVVGVNGTGKTTTCGKLGRLLVGDGKTVVLGAADTFRAAAADQLQTWGDRVGADVVRSDREGADPASVAFEAVNVGIQQGVDSVIVDTAGRLHTKTGLMDELGKIK